MNNSNESVNQLISYPLFIISTIPLIALSYAKREVLGVNSFIDNNPLISFFLYFVLGNIMFFLVLPFVSMYSAFAGAVAFTLTIVTLLIAFIKLFMSIPSIGHLFFRKTTI